MRKTWVWVTVLVLLAIQAGQVIYVVHRESLTFDEGNHMFAGYMMWKTGDYGLNPEHPPLVKLLATLPILGEDLWTPPLKGRQFKAEAYLDGRDWLMRNDGGSQWLIFRMRLAAGLLAIGMSLVVFAAAREWFGTTAGLVALALATFDPNLLGHSALVVTDMGVTLFFLASIYGFYRYVKQPTMARLALAGIVAGLLLATKHSGILLAPMLVLLIVWEIATAAKGTRARVIARLGGAFAAIVIIGVVVLWGFYGFRYAARPAGLSFPTVAEYSHNLSHFDQAGLGFFAKLHLLPESYLIGLADVKQMAQFYPTFILGKQLAHAVWWYFPVVILIKTTLGMLALMVLAAFALVTKRLRGARELAFLLIPWAVYLAVAMASGMNIGSRHILPLFAMSAILAGGAAAALTSGRQRAWMWACGVLIALHIASGLSAFPNYIPYANEAWGGPKNVHNLLSDANADWAQQLIQVKAWQDRHPGEECWFAYFAWPEIDPAMYGVTCHHLPNIDSFWLGGAEPVPATITGNVLISAGDLSGCEWPTEQMNSFRAFQSLKPVETIDDGVFVYRGTFDMRQAAAQSRAFVAMPMMWKGDAAGALPLAREAVATDPTEIMSQTARGDAAAALGMKDEARAAWTAALNEAKKLEPDAQPSYVPDLEGKLAKL
ncbi:MAG TPA: glycosyltransferase family 39 protein [Terracidiphilus sp.]|jgi:4-amino-4-deoxy-L-arabinose transferase-like glycosyltransferase